MFQYTCVRCCTIIFCIISALVSSVGNYAIPGLMGVVLDAISQKNWQKIDETTVQMCGIIVVASIAVFQRGIMKTTSDAIARDIRYDLFYSIIRQDVAYFDENKTGELLTRMSSDTTVLQSALSVNMTMLIRNTILVTVTIVILVLYSWKLTLFLFAAILVFMIFVVCVGNKVKMLSKELQEKKSELGQASEEAISNVRTVKAFASEKYEMEKFRKLNAEVYEVGLRMALVQACLALLAMLLLNGMFAAIVVYGATLAKANEITIGQISSFLLYMIQLIMSFAVFTVVFNNLYQLGGAAEKIAEILRHEPGVKHADGMIIPAN